MAGYMAKACLYLTNHFGSKPEVIAPFEISRRFPYSICLIESFPSAIFPTSFSFRFSSSLLAFERQWPCRPTPVHPVLY